MRKRGNRTEPKGEFGREVTKWLLAREVNNKELLAALREGGATISEQYLNMMIQGVRQPLPWIIDPICMCLGIDGDRRHRLHRAAALDAGFNVGPL